jgi:hypothetical protein
MIEAPPFERKLVKHCFDLHHDWRSTMPKAAAFLPVEAARADALGVAQDTAEVVAHFDDLMRQGTVGSMAQTVKYFQSPMMERGFSVLYCVDPYTGPHWAVSFLESMAHNGESIGLTDSRRAAFQPMYPDGGPVLPAEPLTTWALDDPHRLFPTLTNAEFRAAIKASFSLDHGTPQARAERRKAVDGLLGGYALRNPLILEDVYKISTGRLLQVLQATPGWMLHSPVSDYWPVFEANFPYLADCLTENFSYLLVASTVGEVDFTNATRLAHPNAASSTVNRNMGYHGNAFGPIKRDLVGEIRIKLRNVTANGESTLLSLT